MFESCFSAASSIYFQEKLATKIPEEPELKTNTGRRVLNNSQFSILNFFQGSRRGKGDGGGVSNLWCEEDARKRTPLPDLSVLCVVPFCARDLILVSHSWLETIPTTMVWIGARDIEEQCPRFNNT